MTAMMVERYYYATTIMLALESEACQLLTHVARDNRKRKRGSTIVRMPCSALERSETHGVRRCPTCSLIDLAFQTLRCSAIR